MLHDKLGQQYSLIYQRCICFSSDRTQFGDAQILNLQACTHMSGLTHAVTQWRKGGEALVVNKVMQRLLVSAVQ